MKKQLRIFMILAIFSGMLMITSVSGQAPPPPSHSQNGNQTSPGGTGCPLDQTQSIMLAFVFSLGYAGFALYRRDKKNEA
jgi:hypothetical protein